MKNTLMALAIATLFGSSMAYGHGRDSHSTSVKISKDVAVSSDVWLGGWIGIKGQIAVDSAAVAISDNTQGVQYNRVVNDYETQNKATINGNAGQNATGNVGANVAAGDNNSQSNSAAIAASGAASSSDEQLVFTPDNHCTRDCGPSDPQDPSSSAGGMADAESFARQDGHGNVTFNDATTNNAKVKGSAFENASGNVGVNAAAGDNNEQINSLAAATAENDVYALATATSDQQSHGNFTLNGWDCDPTTNTASLGDNAFAHASGNIGVNVAAGTGNLQSNSLAMAVAGQ
nr:hypothetical protein [Fulvimonas soli]